MRTEVLTVVGVRPQFIKAAAVSRALKAAGIPEIVVNTGQHYDRMMADVFLERLGLPAPAHNLAVGSAPHGLQTARMLERLEPVIAGSRPRLVLVYGDTNSTLAGALAAAKLHIPVGHIEAGLRSFNRFMPEEINRIVTDHLSALLFAPTSTAMKNLAAEGLASRTVRSGDVMLDVLQLFREQLLDISAQVLGRFDLQERSYAVATVHRAENTDDATRWNGIIAGLNDVASAMPVIWPVHPRARKTLGASISAHITRLEPLPYFEMQALIMNARVVLTDSGGLQKEAAFHSVPCVTLRDQTEWLELVEHGASHLAGTDSRAIAALAREAVWPATDFPKSLFGDGQSARIIANTIEETLRAETPVSA